MAGLGDTFEPGGDADAIAEGVVTCDQHIAERLYDRLRDGRAGPIRGHLLAGLDYQDKLARFFENHDEPRAASEFSWPQHRAAAIITFLSPGLRFFHQG